MKTMQRSLLRLIDEAGIHQKIGVEVGVYEGNTSAVLLARYSGLRLFMVDPWETDGNLIRESKDGRNAKQTAIGATWQYRHRAEIMQRRSLDAVDFFADGSLDFVFLDGDHSYKAVVQDIIAWGPKVRIGGLLCGHDYSSPCRRFGVTQAVNEYVAATGKELLRQRARIWGTIQ